MKYGFMKLLILMLLNNIFLVSFSQSLPVSDFNQKPKGQWEFKTKNAVYASPVVCDSIVYTGSTDSVLYAIELNSGKVKWKFRTKGEIRSNVCIIDTSLYLNGGDGSIYAIDRQTGNLIWEFRTKGEFKYDFADYFHSSPIYHKGILYFGSGDSYVYAIDAGKGKLIWSFKTEGIVHSTPVISNNKIFFGSFDGYVYALDLANGQMVWKFKTVGHRLFPKGEVQGSPAAFKNLIFIGARDYNVYAIDQNKGYCHWNKSFTKGWGLNNNVHDSVLYIGSSDERKLISVNPLNGNENWNIDMEFLVLGNNAFSEKMLYVGTTIGKLHGIDLKNGLKVWSFETESYQNARFKYFKNDDSYRDDIYTIIKSNEQFLEVECELGGIFSTPVISNESIIFSSTNGKIYCLK
jgi:eukaryotic-like serine/threonine-protein kinase